MKKAILTTMVLASLFVSSFAQTSEFFNQVNYKGAFGQTNWLKGWTALDHYGYLAPTKTSSNVIP